METLTEILENWKASSNVYYSNVYQSVNKDGNPLYLLEKHAVLKAEGINFPIIRTSLFMPLNVSAYPNMTHNGNAHLLKAKLAALDADFQYEFNLAWDIVVASL